MKILFSTDTLTSGGKERRLIELMKGLKSIPGIDFELAVMSEDIHYREVFDLGIKIHYIIRKRKKDLSVFSKFYKICKDYRPDIVHCWDSMSAVYLVPTCKLLNIKFVNGIVVDTPKKQNFSNKDWLRAKLTFPFSHIIVGNSRAGLAAYRAPKRKSVCVYNGFSFERTKNIGDPGDIRAKFNVKARYVVLMVGAFGVRKDYDSFVDAAMIICEKRRDIEFIAVGDGESFDRISQKIDARFKENIRLLGRQSDIESIISISDICVLATNSRVHGEGISNSILEYMALGKPVIASIGGGTNEIVEDGKTGILINPLDPAGLAGKIEILINDPGLRDQMGRAGKERIQQYFSIDKMVNTFISIYQDSMQNSKTVVNKLLNQ
jgi:glycosyltransferase involved in cell wall biosynthesis